MKRTLAHTLYEQIPDDTLLLQDRGFFCYEDWKALYLRIKLLIRVKSHHVLKSFRTLSDGSYFYCAELILRKSASLAKL